MESNNEKNKQTNSPANAGNKPPKDLIGAAKDQDISLSQAVLGPLDSIFKAQLHAARSFINFLLQLGYPPTGAEAGGQNNKLEESNKPFVLRFRAAVGEGESKKDTLVTIPTLALIPVQPLAIDSAEYELQLHAREIYKHQQIQSERAKKEEKEEKTRRQSISTTENQELEPVDPQKRPWYLIEQPVSIRGTLVPASGGPGTSSSQQYESNIRIKVKVEKAPMPVGLSRLLTMMTEMAEVKGKDKS